MSQSRFLTLVGHRRTASLVALIVAAIVILVPFTSSADVDSNRRPNIVVILADDMGYGDISPYGGWIKTPHLDRLAAEGMRFTDFHSNGAVCSPTRAALMTGRYQQRAGIPIVVSVNHRHLGLQHHEVTIAEPLKAAGYATGIFGKWHLGYRPTYNPIQHGFDRFQGYVSGNVDFISHVDQSGVYDWWKQDKLVEEPGYTTHLITQHALEFIDEHKDEPFFLYLPHEAPHYPYQGPNDKAIRAVGGKFDTHGERTDKKEAYREMVTELDKGVGEVIAKLKEHKLDQNTLVFFFSDNGATSLGSNGKLRGTKGTVWEGGHRVPAIAWWPDRIKPGTTDQMALGMDLMPTLINLTGAAMPKNHRLDGVDLTNVLLEQKTLDARKLYWHHAQQLAMRDGPWKLIQSAKGQKENGGLYDLDNDLAESKNVAKENSQRFEKMTAELKQWQLDVAEGATDQPTE